MNKLKDKLFYTALAASSIACVFGSAIQEPEELALQQTQGYQEAKKIELTLDQKVSTISDLIHFQKNIGEYTQLESKLDSLYAQAYETRDVHQAKRESDMVKYITFGLFGLSTLSLAGAVYVQNKEAKNEERETN